MESFCHILNNLTTMLPYLPRLSLKQVSIPKGPSCTVTSSQYHYLVIGTVLHYYSIQQHLYSCKGCVAVVFQFVRLDFVLGCFNLNSLEGFWGKFVVTFCILYFGNFFGKYQFKSKEGYDNEKDGNPLAAVMRKNVHLHTLTHYHQPMNVPMLGTGLLQAKNIVAITLRQYGLWISDVIQELCEKFLTCRFHLVP